MVETITRNMTKPAVVTSYLDLRRATRTWEGQPQRLASELYPDEAQESGVTGMADQLIAETTVFSYLDLYSRGELQLPKWLEDDQIEDWLAARAVKTVIETQARIRSDG